MFKVVMLILALASSVRCQGKQTREELMREFQRLDVDRDDFISREEFLQKLKRSETFALLYFHDTNKDDKISLDEWFEMNNENADEKVFHDFYDNDGDGFITVDDFRREKSKIVKKEADYTVEELFRNSDSNGKINKEQLVSYLEKNFQDGDIDMDSISEEIDKNGDGYIEKEEFSTYIEDYLTDESEQEIEFFFITADKSKDDKISKKEFIEVMAE